MKRKTTKEILAESNRYGEVVARFEPSEEMETVEQAILKELGE